MMRSVKKWLSGLLCLALLLTVLPTAAWAAGEAGETCIKTLECTAKLHEEGCPMLEPVTRAELAEKFYANENLRKLIDAAAGGETPTFGDISVEEEDVTGAQHTAIVAMAKAGILSGTSPTEFSPDGKVTRAQAAVALWRATGSKSNPEATEPPYSDITGSEPYGPAVLVLTAMNIVRGGAPTGEDKKPLFNATGFISRYEVQVFLERYNESTTKGNENYIDTGNWETGITRLDMLMKVYAQYKDNPVLQAKAASGTSKNFADIGACDENEQAAIEFFTKAGIISGLNTTPPMFQPYGAASNFQIALLLQKCAEASTPGTAETQGISLLSEGGEGAEGDVDDKLQGMIDDAFDFLEKQGVNVTEAEANPHAPGLENSLTSWTDSVAPEKPTFSPTSQTFTGTLEVTINAVGATEGDGTVIYYTTDGSDPAASETKQTYSSAISITGPTTLNAVAVKNNLVSEMAQAQYAYPALTITADPASLTGGGNVTLTVGSEPASAAVPENVTVTCNVSGYTPTKGTDGRWSVTLPNETKEYTFTASATGWTDGAVTVKVTYKGTSSGNTGGSGGGSGSTSTSTERNPDGSTTTTTTNKTTGTVTETTRYPDGSREVVETKRDGTVTTTTTDTDGNETAVVENPDGTREVRVEQADGTSASAVADQAGRIQAEVSLSSRAVSAAQKDGEAVTLPIPNIPISGSSEDASLVEIDLPRSAGAVKVEIPTEDAGPGTVAVIVNEDGTETVVKKSVALDGGLTLTLETGATVKIVDNRKDFDDTYDHWAEDAIAFATAHEMFGGTSADTFSPDTPMTRGMLAVVLHRFEDTPNHTFTGSFEDVAPGSWYADGIHWMADNGIIGGYGDGNFGANDSITREQLATILYRYADVMGYGTSGGASLNRFSDVDNVSGYAVEAMGWAVENGLIGGMGDGTLAPQGSATRAQVATILMRFVENLVN